MIIWQGWGILTLLILGGVPALGVALLGAAMGSRPAPLPFTLATLALVLLGGALNWWVGRRLNGGPGRELIDARTGQRVLLRPRHALFWIPMQYWSVLSLLAALFLGVSLASQLGRGDAAAPLAPRSERAAPAGNAKAPRPPAGQSI
ncbi:hypothetical protein [Roseomonas sp. USHLN139]|uniref:hypothetical protein n=1 Tax=Roseomonas sp. USHLN139 TaxID=3081298 RepID=UPI003B015C3F